jgi:hypothetical protein
MTDKERIDSLENKLARIEKMLAQILPEVQGPKAVKTERKHTFKEEMENLRKAREVAALVHTHPRSVYRAAMKRFFADGGWTPPVSQLMGKGK